jgi:hypothetical protein
VCNILERKSTLEKEKTKKITKIKAHGTRISRLKITKMKSLKTKLTWLFILACSMQILTASTVETVSSQKCAPAQAKQAKVKKTNKAKCQRPLYKTLLSHF